MILRRLKTNHTVNLLLFPLLGVAFWLKNLLNPHLYQYTPGETGNLFFHYVYEWLKHYPLWQNVTALLLFLFIAFEILQISNRYTFIRIRTMLPATLFVLIAGGLTGLHFLHPVYFGVVFLLIAIYRLFSAYDQSTPFSAAFDTGFFLGISVLFYMNLIVLLPAFLLGIGILSRETGWREFIILITGFILPLIFTASIAWLTGNVIELHDIIWLILINPKEYLNPGLHLYIFAGFLALLTILGSARIISLYDKVKASTRRFFIVFFLIFVSSLVSIIANPGTIQEMMLVTVIPVTFLISNYFAFLKHRFWGDFLFLLLAAIAAAMQFFR